MRKALPIFITGDTRSRKILAIMKAEGMGRMVLARAIEPYRWEPWAFDNGAFTDWTKGKELDRDGYLRRIDLCQSIGEPLFAVVPDIVTGGLRSLDFSLEWVDKLPSDWARYLAVQDGMTEADVSKVIHLFDGIFLGGSNRFKGTAPRWAHLAHLSCKPFHYGRAGTLRKIQHAIASGCDSFDSAFPLWSMSRLRAAIAVWKGDIAQHELFPMTAYAN